MQLRAIPGWVGSPRAQGLRDPLHSPRRGAAWGEEGPAGSDRGVTAAPTLGSSLSAVPGQKFLVKSIRNWLLSPALRADSKRRSEGTDPPLRAHQGPAPLLPAGTRAPRSRHGPDVGTCHQQSLESGQGPRPALQTGQRLARARRRSHAPSQRSCWFLRLFGPCSSQHRSERSHRQGVWAESLAGDICPPLCFGAVLHF